MDIMRSPRQRASLLLPAPPGGRHRLDQRTGPGMEPCNTHCIHIAKLVLGQCAGVIQAARPAVELGNGVNHAAVDPKRSTGGGGSQGEATEITILVTSSGIGVR